MSQAGEVNGLDSASGQLEGPRLNRLYEEIRIRLLDLSKRNQLLNYRLNPRSKRYLQIVDCTLESVHKQLAENEGSIHVAPLQEPDDVPTEERTEEFNSALGRARTTDVEYLTAIEVMEATGQINEAELEGLERALRDRLREQLGLPPRSKRKDVNRVEHAQSLGIDPSLALSVAGRAIEDGPLQSLKFPAELKSIMEKIAGDAHLAEQEMGLSTLFLAFGFLEWYESENSDKKAFAPLLLLPVQIEKQKIRGKSVYSISIREGGVEVNLSLQKLLEQNFSRKLPQFENENDDEIGSIEKYLEDVTLAIEGLKRWQIRRWMVLGHFSFGRFVMYTDTDREKWGEMDEQSLVGSLLRGSDQDQDDSTLPSIPGDYQIDDPEIEPIAPFLIQDADASQHSALIDVMKGHNLVVQGPPGTGKSQTITNIIANALAQDKRVLFLAEKQAALDVVKRRLDRSGLGEFCLELHSDKVQPRTVIESVKARYALGTGLVLPAAEQQVDVIWQQTRGEISSYIKALHKPEPDGATPFSLIWQAMYGQTKNDDISGNFAEVQIPKELLLDPNRINLITADLETISSMAQTFFETFGHPASSPWTQIVFDDLPIYDTPNLVKALKRLRDATIAEEGLRARLVEIGIVDAVDIERIPALALELSAAPDATAMMSILDLDLKDLALAVEVQAEIIEVERELSELGDIRNQAINRLEIANKMMDSYLGSSYSDSLPSAVYQEIDLEIENIDKAIDLVQNILTPLAILGVSKNNDVSDLPAANFVAYKLSTTQTKHHKWIVGISETSEKVIFDIEDKWRALEKAETYWRKKVNGYSRAANKLKVRLHGYQSDCVPTFAEIKGIRNTLGQVGLGKFIAKLTGALDKAIALCDRIGISTELKEIDELSKHIHSIGEFEANKGLSEAFGADWEGISMPIEDIYEALWERAYIRQSVQLMPGGKWAADLVFTLPYTKIGSLSSHREAFKNFVDTSDVITNKFSEIGINDFLSQCKDEVTEFRKFLAIDESKQLSSISFSIKKISLAYELRKRNETLRASLSSHATAEHATLLAKDQVTVEMTRLAIRWVDHIRNLNVTPNVKALLLSERVSEIREIIGQSSKALLDIEASRKSAKDSLEIFGAGSVTDIDSTDLLPLLNDLCKHESELSDFVALKKRRKVLDAIGIAEFLATCDLQKIEPARVPSIFGAIVAEARAGVVRRVTELASSNGASLDAGRRSFVDRDIEKIRKDRESIRARLLKHVPPTGSNSGPRKNWTEFRLLENEFPKSKRFVPVRQLLARAGKALQTLKPCFMMSPLSLAKFVAPKNIEFDLLVIDEASQMRPEDAIGGMLRAKQIVVVGDAKQLPPTDFFNRLESQSTDLGFSEDEDDDIDAESILEACETTFKKRRRLGWHYRSRCESLIAFSNNAFYDDALITFPMAKPGSFSVELVRVNGIYRASRNPAEASKVAEEAITFMRHFANFTIDELPTLGIVAVNTNQREFIQEELQRLWTDDELVELYLEKAKSKGEEFFVKNLENVQGDERDHIFISMTYGRKHGETIVSQSFGPINRKQGHRRLNVLFTRARVRIGLFASFGSSDVRPTELSSEGVHILKRYLEYAETKGRAFVRSIGGQADSDFELAVAHRLRMRGYEVDLQVGVSGFRIDLGVRNPDRKDDFLAGVECDGATYHSSKSARDRDRLREEVLKSLGWNIVRVWSTDWFDNPSLETEKLIRKLEAIRHLPVRESLNYPVLFSLDTQDESTQLAPELHNIVSDSSDQKLWSTDEAESIPDNAVDTETHSDNGPLTESEAIAALEAFRDSVIKESIRDWVPQRSILRPAMIESFITQRITDSNEWFSLIPQYLRTGTNPEEKLKFLDAICALVERIDDSINRSVAVGQKDPAKEQVSENKFPLQSKPNIYSVADLTGIRGLDQDQFYEKTYAPVLREMVSYVVTVEGPIFEDVLVDRIARAHGLKRSGNRITQRVINFLPPSISKSLEGPRTVIWPSGKQGGKVHLFRKDLSQVRNHEDTPVEELAAIALPFLRLRMSEEEVLRKIAEEFGLGSLREVTRLRFMKALEIARQSLV